MFKKLFARKDVRNYFLSQKIDGMGGERKGW